MDTERTWKSAFHGLLLVLVVAALGFAAMGLVVRLSSDDCTTVTTVRPNGDRSVARTCT